MLLFTQPQPSPLRPGNSNDIDGNIEFAPSFALFNQSFDMNLESMIGPNASFGLGPMKSLSFGLGLAGSLDYGDNPRASPISIHRLGSRLGVSPREELKAPDVNETTDSPTDGGAPENVQVLCASSSNSFGNVVRASNNESQNASSVMVLGDAVRVASPPSIDKKRGRSPVTEDEYKTNGQKNNLVLDGSARKLPFRLKDSPKNDEVAKVGPKAAAANKRSKQRKSQKLEPAVLKVMENHDSVFGAFSFLLPGAKTILGVKSKSGVKGGQETEAEIARRRVNSALCAFGGVAVPPLSNDPSLKKSPQRQKYEDLLPERYYEDENRLSWEIEEEPPIEIPDEENTSPINARASMSSDSSDSRTALLRNIGVMVYPAVNAFIAAEPGIITPALSEMNNFVDFNTKYPDTTPAKAGQTQPPSTSATKDNNSLPMVSPDSIKSPSIAFSSDSTTPQKSVNSMGGVWISNHQSPGQNMSPVKSEETPSTDLLFVDTQELQPEQYRVVKRRKVSKTLYDYPALPLPYGQRKRISNAMFSMSKSIPGLTDECALVLGEARRKDAWDFAVAQLMTQVIVLTHCSAEDSRLEGLSKYLLTLG